MRGVSGPASLPAAIPSISRCADAPFMTVLLVLIGGGGAWHLCFGMLAMYSAFVRAAGNTTTSHKQHSIAGSTLLIIQRDLISLISEAQSCWLHACLIHTEGMVAEHTACGFMHASLKLRR